MSDINNILNAEASLSAAYEQAVKVLKAQQEKGEGGCIVILSMLGDDGLCKAYGKPEDWAKLLVGVAGQSENFSLALRFAAAELTAAD